MEAARTYLRTGGALICSGKMFSEMTGTASIRKFVNYLLPGENPGLVNCGLLDLYAECDLPASAQFLKTSDSQPALFIGEYGGGIVALLPFDAGALAQDHRTMAKSFYAHRRRLPHERVSMVSKGSLRNLVSSLLQILHHKRGMPYLHSWYCPRDARSLFALRVDTDFGDEGSIEGLSQLARESSVPFSWFVHVRHQQKFLEKFRTMTGHEIGVHCYNHIRYENEAVAAEDLQTAVHALAEAGIEAKSFCAPYGMWSEQIARAVERFGFEYSSEFSYDYDNLPSYPVAGKRLNTLQVPVHPISIGSLRRQGCSEEEMLAYYREIVRGKCDAREPVLLYHHPNNAHENVLKQIIATIQNLSVPVVRMIDYAQWWKRRNSHPFDADISGEMITLRTRSAHDDVWLHVTKGDGTECFSPQESSIDLRRAAWLPVPPPAPLPEDYSRIRKFNPWISVNLLEDTIHRLRFPKS